MSGIRYLPDTAPEPVGIMALHSSMKVQDLDEFVSEYIQPARLVWWRGEFYAIDGNPEQCR